MIAAERAGEFVVEPLGETMLLLRLGERIDIDVNARVHAAAQTLVRVELPGILDLVPAYATLALHYDALFWASRDGSPAWRHLAGALRAVFATPPAVAATNARVVEIPVCYGGDFGPDLDAVAAHAKRDAKTVIALHAAATYRVAMIGFAPGFPYLLGLDVALRIPRRAEPRARVARGAVAIGGAQTGIYPDELPGGWHVIGRTPLHLFDAAREPPCLLGAGDGVRLRAIDAGEFAALESADAA